MKNNLVRWLVSALLMALGFGMKAQAALVAYDGTNITWDVSVLTTPLVAVTVAAVGGAVVLFVIGVGIRKIFRFFKRS